MKIEFQVNGEAVNADINPTARLTTLLRDARSSTLQASSHGLLSSLLLIPSSRPEMCQRNIIIMQVHAT